MKKKILLITTGGTIASVRSDKGLTPGLALDEYIKDLNLPEESLSLATLELMSKDSTDIEAEDWIRIADVVREGAKRGYDGIVITHGTDTMSYTCAALIHLLRNIPIPVVLTGSQLPMDAKDSDGPKNLKDAILVSLMDISGVFLVFDGCVMDGASVRKVDSIEKHAFVSVDGREIGEIYENQLELTSYGKQRVNEFGKNHSFNSDIFNSDKNDGVGDNTAANAAIGENRPQARQDGTKAIVREKRPAVIKLVPGMDGDIIRFYADKGAEAIIIEAYGTGGIPEYLMPDLEYAVEKNIPIYVTTQCLKGGTHMDVYEVNTRALELGKSSEKVKKNNDDANWDDDSKKGYGVIEAGNKTVEYIYTGLVLGKM